MLWTVSLRHAARAWVSLVTIALLPFPLLAQRYCPYLYWAGSKRWFRGWLKFKATTLSGLRHVHVCKRETEGLSPKLKTNFLSSPSRVYGWFDFCIEIQRHKKPKRFHFICCFSRLFRNCSTLQDHKQVRFMGFSSFKILAWPFVISSHLHEGTTCPGERHLSLRWEEEPWRPFCLKRRSLGLQGT